MSDQKKFYELVERYYQAWFRYHPQAAVDAGISGFDGQLPLFDDDDISALTVLNDKLLSSLEEISLDELEPAARLDYQLLYGSAVIEGNELTERDWRLYRPQDFLPVDALYQLTVRPVEDRRGAMKARLQAVPGHLRRARNMLSREPEQIPALWLEAAVAEALAGGEFVTGLKYHPELKGKGLDADVEAAVTALQDFARYLERDIGARAVGDFAAGSRAFNRRLQHRHFLDMDADTLYDFGARLFDRTLDELRQVTRELRGDEDIAALTATIGAVHPAADNLLDTYRGVMKEARDFVRDHDLVSFPETEHLNVVATPVFLRHQIPFAAYQEPSRTDARQQGYYYVTPVQSEEELGEHNTLGLRHTCVHESYPGHHLQFVTANLDPRTSTLPRLTNPSATLYEGWALYCEQLMQEQGFLGAPENRFILLKDRLWRALRIMIDVEIQTRGVSLQQAGERMQRELGFTRGQAMADLTWYSMAPTVPMGYGVGWALINGMRDCLHLEDNGMGLKGFHDELLAEGSVALPLVLAARFGRERWQQVRDMVFGPAH